MTAVEIINLTKLFPVAFSTKKIRALDGVSITVSEGEVFGFLGPNGAGKTTTLKIAMGLIRPTMGSINLLGKNCTDFRVRTYIGYLPEQPYFYDYLTAAEFLRFYSGLFGMKGGFQESRVHELLGIVGLENARNMPLRRFSKGMLQRIGIAQALLNDPKLVVLDEPMSGLDPIGRREMRELILRLKREGKTVFFSSHIISDVEMICDRIAILHKGKILAQGKIVDLLKSSAESELEIVGLDDQGAKIMGGMGSVLLEGTGRLILRVTSQENTERAMEIAKKCGGRLVSLVPKTRCLEDLFIEKVSTLGEP